jgi:catechol 2,3-dioxygenase-like lactoylglutathione lyase family enzyme
MSTPAAPAAPAAPPCPAAHEAPGAAHDAPGAAVPPIHGLHHFAWRCRDVEETRAFYEGVLGLPLVHVIRADTVPSTGEHCPYVHVFFRLGDGSHVAFFDLGDDTAALPSPNTPAWVNHLALRVGSEGELLAAKARLEAAGVAVIGPTDHHIIRSIYFFDPNGIRLELTVPTVPEAEMQRLAAEAHGEAAAWAAEKSARRQARSHGGARG